MINVTVTLAVAITLIPTQVLLSAGSELLKIKLGCLSEELILPDFKTYHKVELQ